jgi:membrane fusion protein (multidrug efflux system)
MTIKFLLAATAVLLLGASALAQPAGGPPAGMPGMGAMGPTQVGVVTMKAETAPITATLPGRIIASATAEVRPQVSGVVTAVAVKEGQPVAAGDLIATIDAASYEAEVAVAEASLAGARAQLPNAQSKADRYETLAGSGGVSEAELGTARVELAQAQASLASAEAQVRAAKLTLERARLTAPISGIVGSVNVQIGSLLTANQADAVTTIRQVDPVEITLVESSANLLASRSARPGGAPVAEADAGAPPLAVTVTLEDGSTYDQVGTISSMDLVVSETTGTFTLHANMPNPDRMLLPGMFVRATIDFGKQPNVFLVPQRAVTFSADGTPVAFFVGADGKATERELTAERVVNNAWVVTAGVAEGDQLIVDGLQKIREGSEVTPLQVTIEANGVVYQEAPTMPAAGATGMPPGGPPAGGMPEGAAPPAGAPADRTAPATEGAN